MTGLLPLLLVFGPLVAAGVTWRFRRADTRARILLGVAAGHASAVGALWAFPDDAALGGWLAADALGLVVLTLVSVLFLAIAHYAGEHARIESPRGGRAFESCLLAFLGAATLVALSQQMALLWVGMESTTLAIASLIYHRHDRRSLEAVWKYLVLSSVGIALALLAVFLVASAQGDAPGARALMLPDLLAGGASLDRWWLRAATVFALVGFGTKMGLAPLHSWKPDTYGEAPSAVAGLMSGALTSCAFLGVARFAQVCEAAGLASFVRPLLIALGLLSLIVAAAFILGQADLKRLLAYSSVEHMGLLVLGIGLGGVGAYGSVLHVLNNGLAKGLLFLVAGNLVLAAGSSATADLRGMLRERPVSSVLLVAGLFAVTGSPPFGLFVSEYAIVSGAVREHHPWIAGAIVLLLSVIFVGIAAMMIDVVFGERAPTSVADGPKEPERLPLLAGPLVLGALVLMLGVYLPAPLRSVLAEAAKSLGGAAP